MLRGTLIPRSQHWTSLTSPSGGKHSCSKFYRSTGNTICSRIIRSPPKQNSEVRVDDAAEAIAGLIFVDMANSAFNPPSSVETSESNDIRGRWIANSSEFGNPQPRKILDIHKPWLLFRLNQSVELHRVSVDISARASALATSVVLALNQLGSWTSTILPSNASSSSSCWNINLYRAGYVITMSQRMHCSKIG